MPAFSKNIVIHFDIKPAIVCTPWLEYNLKFNIVSNVVRIKCKQENRKAIIKKQKMLFTHLLNRLINESVVVHMKMPFAFLVFFKFEAKSDQTRNSNGINVKHCTIFVDSCLVFKMLLNLFFF